MASASVKRPFNPAPFSGTQTGFEEKRFAGPSDKVPLQNQCQNAANKFIFKGNQVKAGQINDNPVKSEPESKSEDLLSDLDEESLFGDF